MLKIKNKILSAQIDIPEKLIPQTDKKSGAKSVYFPFQFPSGENGALVVIKLVKMGWIPINDIENILIKFK
jgi:hypothetical protein